MYDLENFDLNFEKFMDSYGDIETYIDTTNKSDGRVLLKLLETLDEKNKQYLVKIKIKIPGTHLKDRYAFTVFNLGMDNGRTVFIHTTGMDYYKRKYKEHIGKNDEEANGMNLTTYVPNENGRGFTCKRYNYFDLDLAPAT